MEQDEDVKSKNTLRAEGTKTAWQPVVKVRSDCLLNWSSGVIEVWQCREFAFMQVIAEVTSLAMLTPFTANRIYNTYNSPHLSTNSRAGERSCTHHPHTNCSLIASWNTSVFLKNAHIYAGCFFLSPFFFHICAGCFLHQITCSESPPPFCLHSNKPEWKTKEEQCKTVKCLLMSGIYQLVC